MSLWLVIALGFVLGLLTTASSTMRLLSIEKRRPLPTASWGLAVDLLQGTAIVLAVRTEIVPVLLADAVGCFIADYFVIHRQLRKEKPCVSPHVCASPSTSRSTSAGGSTL